MESREMKNRCRGAIRKLEVEMKDTTSCRYGKGYAAGLRLALYEFRKAIDKRRR